MCLCLENVPTEESVDELKSLRRILLFFFLALLLLPLPLSVRVIVGLLCA